MPLENDVLHTVLAGQHEDIRKKGVRAYKLLIFYQYLWATYTIRILEYVLVVGEIYDETIEVNWPQEADLTWRNS